MVGLYLNSSYASNKTFILARQQAQASASIARLSSGNRITRASDDISALSVSTTLSSQLTGLRSARINSAQASSLIEVANGGMSQIETILQRMNSLSTMANSGVVTPSERGFLDQEFQQLKQEIDRIANETNFNGVNLLNRYVKPEAINEVTTQTTIETPSDIFLTFQPFGIGSGNVAPSASIDTDAPVNVIAENIANGTAVGITANATDPEATVLTYSLSNNAGARFAIDSVTGVVTVANGTLLNFEVNTSHTITVRAADAGGLSSNSNFTINVTNANEAPFVGPGLTNQTTTELSSFSYTFPAQNGAFADPDSPDPLTYSVVGALPGWLTFNAGSRTFSGTPANGDVGTSTITVRATDGGGLFVDDSFDITVNNANFAPINLIDNDGAANSVAENSANGTAVGLTGFATDPDLDAITYTLSNSAGGRFTINGATGIVTVANSALLNFESATNHTVRIRATDTGGLFTEQDFVINVTNVNENPFVTGGLTNQTASEATAFTYTFAAQPTAFSDPDTPDPLTYSVVGALPGWLTFNAATRTFSGTPANADVGTSTITVRATDGGGLFVDDSFNLTVNNINFAPINLIDNNGAANSIAENSANGSVVGLTGLATDPDLDAITYTLSNNAGGRFAINGATGIVTVANSALLDFESATNHTVRIRATDTGGLFTEQDFVINVTNVNENPFVTGGLTNQTATEATAFTYSFAAQPTTYSDPDTADTLTYSVVGALPGWLTFNAGTSTFSGTPANADVGTTTITVRATDGGGLFIDDTFDIIVNDINQAPINLIDNNGAANSIAENSANGSVVGLTGLATDPDLDAITYTLSNNAGGAFRH